MLGTTKHLLVVIFLLPSVVGAQVEIKLKQDRIDVAVNRVPFTSLHMGREANKPFLYPLRTAAGRRVTRGFPEEPSPGDPIDHPHQRGMWIGTEHLSGVDLWENDPSYTRPRMGTIVFKDVMAVEESHDRGRFTTLADWVGPEGDSMLTESRTMTFYSAPENYRILDIDLHLKAKREVVFEDHHDAIIGIRLGPGFAEKNGGRPVNAEGLQGEAGTRGERSEWVDWEGDAEGERAGVTLMDHPENFNFPTRWHIRSMGLLVASPFASQDFSPTLPNRAMTLAAGDELHLRYRLLIHPPDTDIPAAFQEFIRKCARL